MSEISGFDRRGFLRLGVAAGAGLTVAAEAAGAAPAKAQPRGPAGGVEELTLDELQKRMAAGTLSARALTETYLARIDALDRRGPALHSVLEVDPDAPAIAAALDDERRTKGPRGPLHGIPVLVKDNVDTAGKLATTAGSLALAGAAPRDATIVERLRAAGAIIIGKTNLSEWANFRSTRSSSGWSARGGQCRNPYVLDRNPCGSSSGSGAAAAANLCAVAVGTETDGSIVCPSSINGLVGVKPTVGLVSRAGIVPISHSQDTAGPMARCVRDAAILLSALTGVDPRDPATREAEGHVEADYARFLNADGLRGARLGVWRKHFDADTRVARLMEQALVEMARRGAVLVDPVECKAFDQLDDPELEVLLFEFKTDVEDYLATRTGLGPKALADMIAFNEAQRSAEMPYFDQELFLKAQAKGPLTTPAYREALDTCRRLARTEGIDALVEQHRLDAIVAPTGGPAWLTDLVTGDHFSGPSCSTPAAVAGYPHVTVPLGFVFGLPVGVSFFGRAWSEPTLLRIAYAFEQATQARRPPRFLPTAEL